MKIQSFAVKKPWRSATETGREKMLRIAE